MLITSQRHGLSFLCLLGVLAAGCETAPQMDYSKVDLVDVSGTVQLDGAPLADAVITFEDPETGTFSFAMTSSSGSYTLQFDSVKNGCTPGKKLVRVSTTRRVLGLNSSEEGGGGGEGAAGEQAQPAATDKAAEKVPACYYKESKLNVEVTPDSGPFHFDLKSDYSTTGATS